MHEDLASRRGTDVIDRWPLDLQPTSMPAAGWAALRALYPSELSGVCTGWFDKTFGVAGAPLFFGPMGGGEWGCWCCRPLWSGSVWLAASGGA